jgi:hypothetical protein
MGEKEFNKHVWKIMLFLSIVVIVWTLFMMSRGNEILPTAFKLADSPQLTEDIEQRALDFMNMTMLKPLWEGLWVGIFGVFIAFGLKNKIQYAWTLGVFWGIMMITNATIQGGYEIFILGWPNACLQTYMILFPGLIALISLLIARKEFTDQSSLGGGDL